jgi:hypothetical protein
MRWVLRLAAVTLGAATVAGVAWASRAPLDTGVTGDGVLRLAWSARPERLETCREPSAGELAALPAHMRQPLVCEGFTASYRLEVLYNDRPVAAQVVRGGGLRQDRRLYVFRELAVPPGQARISVRVTRVENPEPPPESPRQNPRQALAATAIPPQLSLSADVRFSPGRVVLVTYEPEQRRLVVLGSGDNASPSKR